MEYADDADLSMLKADVQSQLALLDSQIATVERINAELSPPADLELFRLSKAKVKKIARDLDRALTVEGILQMIKDLADAKQDADEAHAIVRQCVGRQGIVYPTSGSGAAEFRDDDH